MPARPWVPVQRAPPTATDFSKATATKRGYLLKGKRKLDAYAAQADEEAATHADRAAAGAPSAVVNATPAKKAKHNVAGVGKASGRRWKEPAPRANTLRPAILSTTWAKKMAAKAERASFQAAKAAVVAARKDKARGVRAAREAARDRKEAATAAAAAVQKITKTSTLQRLMKSRKQRKTLRKADTV